MNIKNFIEIAGWCGMGAIILAYGLLSYEVLLPTSILFQSMNLFGAITLIVSSYDNKAYQVMVLNAFFAIIAITAIFKVLI